MNPIEFFQRLLSETSTLKEGCKSLYGYKIAKQNQSDFLSDKSHGASIEIVRTNLEKLTELYINLFELSLRYQNRYEADINMKDITKSADSGIIGSDFAASVGR